MSKDKKVHVVDKTAKPATPENDPVEAAVAAAPPAPEPEADVSVPPSPSVEEILAKLTPEEVEVLKAKMRARKAKAANGTLQGAFDAALAKVTENLSDLHKIVVDFGFTMPFQLSIGTGLDGKPFVDGKRLRAKREKKGDAPVSDAPAAQ
jgi:type IV secretory pathway VirB10-like protein